MDDTGRCAQVAVAATGLTRHSTGAGAAMNFEFNAEQKMFRDSVRGFAERHLAAGALARAHQPDYPWDVARLMAEQGLMGIAMKEEDGGQGGTLMDAIIALETVAQLCPRS